MYEYIKALIQNNSVLAQEYFYNYNKTMLFFICLVIWAFCDAYDNLTKR